MFGYLGSRIDKLPVLPTLWSWKPHILELALIIGAYFVYLFTRGLVFDDLESAALANAERVISLERSLRFFWEPHWQEWAITSARALVIFFNWVYIITYWPIIFIAALVLYIVNRRLYTYYRNMIMVSLALALLVFMLFPVAPPRLVSRYFVDTIQSFGPSFYGSPEMSTFYNAHAAMPSLHFSWTLLFGIMFLRILNPWLKVLGLLYPVLTFFAITITGNHYILDAIVGAVAAAVALAVVEWRMRRRLSSGVTGQ